MSIGRPALTIVPKRRAKIFRSLTPTLRCMPPTARSLGLPRTLGDHDLALAQLDDRVLLVAGFDFAGDGLGAGRAALIYKYRHGYFPSS